MQINLWKQQHLIYKPGVSQDIIFSQYFIFSTSSLLEAGLKIDHIPFHLKFAWRLWIFSVQIPDVTLLNFYESDTCSAYNHEEQPLTWTTILLSKCQSLQGANVWITYRVWLFSIETNFSRTGNCVGLSSYTILYYIFILLHWWF